MNPANVPNTTSTMNPNSSRSASILSTAISGVLVLMLLVLAWAYVVRQPLSTGTPAASAGQTGDDQSTTAKLAQITVRGSGTISVRPDLIVMNVGASIQESDIEAAQAEVSTVIGAMQAKLKAAGIAEKDYRTVQYNVEPVMDYGVLKEPQTAPQAPQLVGFRVTNMLEITVRDPERAAGLINDLVGAGANTIYNVSYTFSDPGGLAKQAYDEAIVDAQARAVRLAALSNMQLGRILDVTEASANVPDYWASGGIGGAGGAGPFYPGQQSVQVDVIVTYEATPVGSSGSPGSTTSDLDAARETLIAYFTALNQGRYDEAAKLYGGEYTTLMDWNPRVSPDDHARLFENGCKVNGLQCLTIKRIVDTEQASPSEFKVVVEFANADGTMFKLAPAGGASEGTIEAQQPARTQFEYIVERTVDGKLLVRDLPVYVP